MGREQAVLGIDLGTSGLKALVSAMDGRVLGRGQAAYLVTVPAEGHAETDPEAWWRAACSAVREALAGPDVDVAGLAVAGQMHGVVLAGTDGTPSRPAILWLDRRAAAEAAGYDRLPSSLTGPLGNQPSPGMAGPILRWLTSNEPRVLEQARWVLQPKDWLRLRLTGEAATDPTDASGTLLFDLPRNTWAQDLIEVLGLPGDKLPEVRDPAAVAGHLLPAPAAALGLRPGIPVATGAADTAAALFAVRLRAGQALLTLGTGGQWVVPASFRPVRTTNLFRTVDGGLYRLAAAQNVGETLNWVRTLLGVSWQHMYDTAARPWRPDTPLFLPYLAEERWDPGAKGSWAGLTLAHGRDHLLRGALEGVAFLLRKRLEDLRAAGHDPAMAIVGGGGASHPAWRQLLADVLGLPLYPAATTWLSPAGAALIAAAALAPAAAEPAAEAAEAAEAGAGAGTVTSMRSGYGEAEVVAPGERGAASASYGRWRLAAHGPLLMCNRAAQALRLSRLRAGTDVLSASGVPPCGRPATEVSKQPRRLSVGTSAGGSGDECGSR